MKKQLVHMKGTKEGLILRLDDQCAYEDLLKELERKVSEGGIDGKVDVSLHLGYRYLPEHLKQELVNVIQQSSKMVVSKVISNVITVDESAVKMQESQCDTYVGIVRSGQVIHSPGDVIIVGDVNPNGKVEAGGNIYVLGKLKGIVHAGVHGNRDAIIAASWFAPTHVYIADVIEVMSNEKPIVKEHAEQLFAYINKEGMISYNRLQEVRHIRPLLNIKGGS